MARDRIETEAGSEIRCAKCREFWPIDPEFFYIQNGVPHSWCKACYVETRMAAGTTDRTGTGATHNDHARAP